MERDEKKLYTINDVAQELGISKTTVSRAISGKGRISQATRERVLACIRKYDYRPNVLAKGLAQSKSYNLGLLLPSDGSEIDFLFFKECMSGICEKAAEYDYDVVIAMVDGKDMTRLERMIADRKVDGVIVSRALVNSPVQRHLTEKGVPFVMIGTPELSAKETGAAGPIWIDNQNREGSRELVGLLLMKGLRRLALIGGNHTHLVTKSRLQGYLDAHSDHYQSAEESLLFLDVGSYAQVGQAVDAILASGADGIICMDDYIANMVLGCLREREVRIPEDIRVASLYDSTVLEYHMPAITSLHFNTKGLGQNACLLLLELLGETVGEACAPLNYQVILRGSTK